MTKQEKIQEDVAEILTFFHIDIEWKDLAEDSKKPYRNKALILLSYLHSQGFKVNNRKQAELKIGYYVQRAMLKAGFVAVGPIIEQGAGPDSGEHSPENVKEVKRMSSKKETAQKAYEKDATRAEKAYQKAAAPAEKAFLEAIAPAEEEYDKALEAAEEVYEKGK